MIHTLLDLYHPINVGQRLQLLKFLIVEFLSSHVTSFYAQIFYPPTLPSMMAPVNTCYLCLEGTLFESLPGHLAIMTDSLDMSVFGLVEPEERGTKMHHNVGNYTHVTQHLFPEN